MRPFNLTAMMALLLSDVVSAAVVTVTICESTPSFASTLVFPLESTSGSPPAPVIVISTVTVLPMPVSTAPGIFYSSGMPTGKGIPSGIFFTGHRTGSGAARPTGSPKYGNHTHHHHPTSSGSSSSNSTSTKIPFFTLTYTGTLPLPTLSSTMTPEFETTGKGSSLAPYMTSTECPDMPSPTQTSPSTTPTTRQLQSNSANSTPTLVATSPYYRRKRATRRRQLVDGDF
ncbi:hypothetical protein F5882DRAFT_394870 [Hyaloscypha sp. PMI_1271]|nr:hypothetical protein F5882DRAFT_394870 [Hyaloscypha sp. PMI_1271]